MAPFFSGGGYSSEATALMTGLRRHLANLTMDQSPTDDASVRNAPRLDALSIVQHGDSFSNNVLESMPHADRSDLMAMHRAHPSGSSYSQMSVCHSEPGAWTLGAPGRIIPRDSKGRLMPAY